jgi:hypothetical protein
LPISTRPRDGAIDIVLAEVLMVVASSSRRFLSKLTRFSAAEANYSTSCTVDPGFKEIPMDVLGPARVFVMSALICASASRTLLDMTVLDVSEKRMIFDSKVL